MRDSSRVVPWRQVFLPTLLHSPGQEVVRGVFVSLEWPCSLGMGLVLSWVLSSLLPSFPALPMGRAGWRSQACCVCW